jgi:hypothetical protein
VNPLENIQLDCREVETQRKGSGAKEGKAAEDPSVEGDCWRRE